MAAEKRPASNVFGSQQMVVKRQKSETNLSGSKTLAVAGASLAQVSHSAIGSSECELSYHEGRMADVNGV